MMNKISDYKILQADSAEKLQKEVLSLFLQGYVLAGGVSVVRTLQFENILSQAVCKFSE